MKIKKEIFNIVPIIYPVVTYSSTSSLVSSSVKSLMTYSSSSVSFSVKSFKIFNVVIHAGRNIYTYDRNIEFHINLCFI